MRTFRPAATSRLRSFRAAAPALAAVLLLGCAAVEHGVKTGKVAGRTLATRSAEGAERLASETAVDTTMQRFLAENGKPDYIHVVSRQKLYAFWVEKDMAALFVRDVVTTSKVNRLGRIPGTLMRMLPDAAAKRIQARRSVVQRKAEKQHLARLRNSPAPSPASLGAPPSYVNRKFDVEAMVARMRPPMTAADPGVSGWREVRLAGGKLSGTAKAGSTQYEVRPDRITASTAMPSKGRKVPGAARLAIVRINAAIYGAQAERISEVTLSLAASVAADRSGRTRVSKRIAGRTVRIDRSTDRGLILYSVYP